MSRENGSDEDGGTNTLESAVMIGQLSTIQCTTEKVTLIGQMEQ